MIIEVKLAYAAGACFGVCRGMHCDKIMAGGEGRRGGSGRRGGGSGRRGFGSGGGEEGVREWGRGRGREGTREWGRGRRVGGGEWGEDGSRGSNRVDNAQFLEFPFHHPFFFS